MCTHHRQKEDGWDRSTLREFEIVEGRLGRIRGCRAPCDINSNEDDALAKARAGGRERLSSPLGFGKMR